MRHVRLSTALTAILLASAAGLGAPSRAAAQSPAEFYAGKQVRLVIGYGTGGGYDTYAKLLARFIGEHIPGKPTIVPQNMPGAGSRSAGNWLYNVAPKDGTVIAMLSQGTPADQALGQPGVKFDVRKFNWIGNMVVVNNIMFVSASTGVRTLDDATKKQLAVGATGASSPSVLYPQVSNNLLGTKFKIISGYPGGGDINLAVERGEVDGRGSDSWASLKANDPEWIKDKKVNILFQIGPKKEADLDAPLWADLAKNDEQRQVLEVLSGDVAVGRPILTAPDVPADRVAALRAAFDATLKDPKFLAAAKQARMDMNPLGGAELQDIAAKIVSNPPELIAKVKDALTIKDVQQLPGAQKKGGKKKE